MSRTCGKPKQYELNGESHTIVEWAKISGVSAEKIRNRLRIGYTLEKAISSPHDLRVGNTPKSVSRYEYQGGTYTIKELAQLTGIASNKLSHRLLLQHRTVEEATDPLYEEKHKRGRRKNGDN